MSKYWIRGDDGEEYGPVELDELREWASENRAGLGTEVRKDDEDALWKSWEMYPELVVLLASLHAQEQRATEEASSTQQAPANLKIGRLLPRILAFCFDIMLLNLFSALILSFVLPWLPKEYELDPEQLLRSIETGETISPLQGWITLGLLIFFIIYFTVFHGVGGQTPGKRLFRLRVVNEHGLTPSYRCAFFRSLAMVLSVIAYFIGFLVAFFNPKRRTVHDYLCKTLVVRSKEVSSKR